MLSYCLNCRKNTESKNPKVVSTKTEEWWFYWNVQCMTVKFKEQEASGLVSSLGIKGLLSGIPLAVPILF